MAAVSFSHSPTWRAKAASAKRLAEEFFQLGLQGRAVEAFGRFRLVCLEGLALHEQALAGEDRRQFVMGRGQRLHLGADAEQLGDEILDMGGKLDQQGRFILARRRRLAPGIELRAQLFRQAGTEFHIQPREPFGAVEIGEDESVGEGKFGHDLISLRNITSAARSGSDIARRWWPRPKR